MDSMDKINAYDEINKFLWGDHDVDSFVKILFYGDILEYIRENVFSDLSNTSSLEDFLKAGNRLYSLNFRLNIRLSIIDINTSFDEICMYFCACEILDRFGNAPSLKKETKESLAKKLETYNQGIPEERILFNKERLEYLSFELEKHFKHTKIKDITDFILNFANDNAYKNFIERDLHKGEDIDENLIDYLTRLRDERNLSSNSLGAKAGVSNAGKYFDFSNPTRPEKHTLIKLAFAMELSQGEFKKLFSLAQKGLERGNDSNKYSFIPGMKRDELILHWLKNIKILSANAKGKSGSIVEELNSILSKEGFEPL